MTPGVTPGERPGEETLAITSEENLMIPVLEREDVFPICPHCGKDLASQRILDGLTIRLCHSGRDQWRASDV